MTPLCQRIEKTPVNTVIAMKGNITVVFPAAQRNSWYATVLCWEIRNRLAKLKCAIIFIASMVAALAGLGYESETRSLKSHARHIISSKYFVFITLNAGAYVAWTSTDNLWDLRNLKRDLPSRHTLTRKTDSSYKLSFSNKRTPWINSLRLSGIRLNSR